MAITTLGRLGRRPLTRALRITAVRYAVTSVVMVAGKARALYVLRTPYSQKPPANVHSSLCRIFSCYLAVYHGDSRAAYTLGRCASIRASEACM